jgi:hypothetical protein
MGAEHEEIYDTECREAMREAIHYGFLKPAKKYTLPDDYGLTGSEANAAVRQALQTYINAAKKQAEQLDFHGRLAAFQDLSVSTPGRNNYDDFFGHIPPRSSMPTATIWAESFPPESDERRSNIK